MRIAEGTSGRRRAPIVAYTRNAASVDQDALLAAGFDDAIAKPASVATLTACSSRWKAVAHAMERVDESRTLLSALLLKDRSLPELPTVARAT